MAARPAGVGSTACDSGPYTGRYVPWAGFADLPASANQPFSALPRTPADWTALPAVSFVIPNVQGDRHDGSIGQGDSWIRENLGCADRARSHDSPLVVNWDENGTDRDRRRGPHRSAPSGRVRVDLSSTCAPGKPTRPVHPTRRAVPYPPK